MQQRPHQHEGRTVAGIATETHTKQTTQTHSFHCEHTTSGISSKKWLMLHHTSLVFFPPSAGSLHPLFHVSACSTWSAVCLMIFCVLLTSLHCFPRPTSWASGSFACVPCLPIIFRRRVDPDESRRVIPRFSCHVLLSACASALSLFLSARALIRTFAALLALPTFFFTNLGTVPLVFALLELGSFRFINASAVVFTQDFQCSVHAPLALRSISPQTTSGPSAQHNDANVWSNHKFAPIAPSPSSKFVKMSPTPPFRISWALLNPASWTTRCV